MADGESLGHRGGAELASGQAKTGGFLRREKRARNRNLMQKFILFMGYRNHSGNVQPEPQHHQ
jgi:hypothetical protein